MSLVVPFFFPPAPAAADEASGPPSGSFAESSLSRREAVKRAAALLASHTSLELRFSEARCQRALPMALAAYKEGLQPHYLEGYHNAKVGRSCDLLG